MEQLQIPSLPGPSSERFGAQWVDSGRNITSDLYAHLSGRVQEMIQQGRGPLRPREIVHRVFLDLLADGELEMADQRAFQAEAARTLRQVLVDRGREYQRRARIGKAWRRIRLAEAARLATSSPAGALDVLALHRALNKLALLDVVKARIAEAHLFSGMSPREIGLQFGLTALETDREWRRARAWLFCELAGPSLDSSELSSSASLPFVD